MTGVIFWESEPRDMSILVLISYSGRLDAGTGSIFWELEPRVISILVFNFSLGILIAGTAVIFWESVLWLIIILVFIGVVCGLAKQNDVLKVKRQVEDKIKEY